MTDLYQRYQTLQAEQNLYQRDAAAVLGVSEGEIVASLPHSTYLGSQINDFLQQLESLGNITSIVRNDLAVSEKTGVYRNLDLSPMMGTAINMGGLDLRLFLRRWRHIFAVSDGKKHSFQIFDAQGCAIQKIYLTDDSQTARFEAICRQFADDGVPQFDQPSTNRDNGTMPAETGNLKTLSPAEIRAYQEQWRGLQNVHHFRVVLSQFGIDRLQGLTYAPEGDALPLNIEAIEAILQRCVAGDITLLTFVNNSGMVQIQTGKVHHVVRARGWLNILDHQEENFTLHLNDQAIAQFWFVRRPGSNGIVHSFEAYDAKRELVLQLFGRQADANSEPENWRKLVQAILTEFQIR